MVHVEVKQLCLGSQVTSDKFSMDLKWQQNIGRELNMMNIRILVEKILFM